MPREHNGESPVHVESNSEDKAPIENAVERTPTALEAYLATLNLSLKAGEDMMKIAMGWSTALSHEVEKSVGLLRTASEVQHEIVREKYDRLQNGEIMEVDPTVITAAQKLSEAYGKIYLKALSDVSKHYFEQSRSMIEALATGDLVKMEQQLADYATLLETVNEVNPDLMEEAKEATGFAVENPLEYTLLMETPRAKIWQVLPLEEGVEVDDSRKPVLLVSPFMLEDRIMAIDPHGGMSFAHQFANEGIPTYVIRFDNPNDNEATRDMTGEEFTEDLAAAASTIKQKHGRSVALQTVCQGAYLSLLAMCTGRLHDSVDAFTQIVPPNGQTVDPILQESLQRIPASDRGQLPKMNPFPASASTLSMQLNNLQNPVSNVISAVNTAKKGPMSTSAAAMGVWLESHAIRSMPREMVQLTLEGAMKGVTPEGGLPQTLFGQELSLETMREKIRWGIFAGGRDTVVHKDSAVLPEVIFKDNPLPNLTVVVDENAGHVSFLTAYTTKTGRQKNAHSPLELHKKWEREEGEQREAEETAFVE
jgi:hypothetical protein